MAESVGLHYRWGPRHRSPLTNLDTFGAGCAFLDLNRDGRTDVLVVGEPGIRLYLGKGSGFEEVSARLGLDRYRGHWMGIAVGDADADGWPDLLITGFRRLLLLRNQRGGGFVDRTSASGLDPANWKRWAASAGFADLDADGDLDLVLMNYVQMGPDAPRLCELAPGVMGGCPPREYKPEYTRLYRHENGRFRDVTVASGSNTTHGKGLALAFCDYNGDGRPDIYLGNDGTPSDLLLNLGSFRFRNVGIETGAAFGTMNQPTAAMGADWGDYDLDGDFDLAASAFSDEDYSLLEQVKGRFRPISDRVGLALPTFKALGFGTLFLDADNDGRLDLHFMNGHVYDNVHLVDPANTYAQPIMLFRQEEDGRLTDVAREVGAEFATPLVGRGSALGDFNEDGRQDLLVVDLEGRLRLYRNESAAPNHWTGFHLVGARSGNRDAYGALVEVRTGSAVRRREVWAARSYLSSSDPRVHFGLGGAERLDSVKVRWPSGRVQVARGVAVDRWWRWEEGKQPGAID